MATAGLPLGLWPQVRARVRTAQEWELPAGAGVRDDRVVEFWQATGSGLHILDDSGLYSPLREPDLLGKFTHVFAGQRLPTDKAVVDFYAQYGPLQEFVIIDDQRLPIWTQRLDPQDQERLSAEARHGLIEPLWWVREQALELRLTYDLYVALKERRTASLRALLGDLPSGKRILSMYILAGRLMRDLVEEQEVGRGENLSRQEGVVRRPAGSFAMESQPSGAGAPPPRLRPLTEEEARYWGRMVLTSQLNAAEERSIRRWVPQEQILPQAYSRRGEPDGGAPEDSLELVRVRGFSGLTTALYLQLGDLLERDAVLRHCPGCQRLFYPARSDQIYCDARCGDAARQRVHYAERKEGRRKPVGSRRRSRKTGSHET